MDLAFLSVRNTPSAGHTLSPAQCLFGRTLHTDLPQSAATLEPRTSPRDTVVLEDLHRKSQQEKAYDKRVGQPLPKLPPGSYVYAKPPPSSLVKAWIPGWIVSPAGPRSYLIQMGTSQIRRNRAQVQLAPSQSSLTPPQPRPVPTLPDKLRPYSSCAGVPGLHLQSRPTADSSPMSATQRPACYSD